MKCLICKKKGADGQRVIPVTTISVGGKRGDWFNPPLSNQGDYVHVNCLFKTIGILP